MKIFYKSQYNIVLIVVLALLFQIVGPIIGDVYAEEEVLGDQGKVIDQIDPDEATTTEDLEDLGEDGNLDHGEEPEESEKLTELESLTDEEEMKLIEPEKSIVVSESKKLEDIFTFDYLKVNGEVIDDSTVVKIGDGTTVELGYRWDTIGKDAKAGDIAEIQVPDAFKLDRTWADQDIKLNDGETVVGKYSLIDNMLRFVFDEGIEAGHVANGFVNFKLKFNEKKFEQDVVEEIEFSDTSDKTIIVIGKPENTVSVIAKTGVPDSEQDAKKITWTIDIMNLSETKISDAKLKDIVPEGLKLELSSIKVKNLRVGLDGTLTLGDDFSVSPEVSGNEFEIDFAEIDPYKGYRIEYTTTIEDNSKTSFTNSATLSYGGEKLPAKATVSVERSAGIEKYGNYIGNDKVDWWIDINKNGGTISDAKVEDELPDGHKLINSIEIVKLIKEGNDWKESPYETTDKFPVNLGEVGPEDAYRIKFKTEIDYSKVNGGDYKKDNKFTNKATLKDGDTKIGEAEKTVKVERKSIIRKEGKAEVDYEKKQIKWTVYVNEANHSIKNAVVTDILPKGLSIDKGDIKVTKVDDDSFVILEGNIKINPDPSTGNTETTITIDLGDIEEGYKIEYITEITDLTIDKFENSASLGGSGIGSGGKIPVVPVDPPKNSYNKEFSGIDYDKKTMDWTITIDPRREAIRELKIIDTFPNKGLILLEDTLVVMKGDVELELGMNYTVTGHNEGTDAGYHKGFTIDIMINGFIEDNFLLNEKLTISYTTSYDPEKGIDLNTGGGLYKNQAKFEGKTDKYNEIDQTRNAEKKVIDESWNSGKKVGKLISANENGEIDGWHSGNERKIKWEVYINYLKQNLGKKVTVRDDLGYDGIIDEASIEVKTYTVAPGGGTGYSRPSSSETGFDESRIRIMSAIPEKQYEVTMDDDGKGFTLTFNEEVKERYVIIFTTNVPDISQKVYTNTVNVNAKGKDYPLEGSVSFNEADKNITKESFGVKGDRVYTDDEVNWKIKINEALSTIQEDVKVVDTISSGLVYVNDSLRIYKLEGSERVLIKKGESIEDGDYTLGVESLDDGRTKLTILFSEEINSTHEIEYTTVVTATDGTVNNKVVYSGKNLENKTIVTKELKAEQFSSIGGDRSKGKIKIIKEDKEGNPITAEAEFKVYYMLNGEKQLVKNQTYKTVYGVVEINDLNFRTYFIEEVTPPKGFELDSEPIEVVVDKASEVHEYVYNIKNDNTEIDITGTKVWDGGPTPRPTIELQLYRDSEAFGDPVELKNGQTTHTWGNLVSTDNDGKEYVYTVDEIGVPEDYGKERSEDRLTVTNIYKSPKTEVTGRKVWIGGSTPRPTIELQLYRNGEAFGDLVELKDGDTEYTWIELDRTDRNGIVYKYTIDEVRVPNRYRKSISDDGLTITNRYVRPTDPTDPVEPTDPEDPLIAIVLDPPAKGEVIITEDGGWEYIPNPGESGDDNFILVHPGGREELIEIDLDDIPLGTTSVKNGQPILPKTGASSNILFYTTGLLLIALGVLLRKRKTA